MRQEILDNLNCKFINPNFTKNYTLEIFNLKFYGGLKIDIKDNNISIDNDINFVLNVDYKNNDDKKIIYGFIQYMILIFDFSFTLEIYSFKDIKETLESLWYESLL